MSFENAEFCVAHLRSRSGTLRLGSGAPRVVSFGFGGASGGSGTDLEGSLQHAAPRRGAAVRGAPVSVSRASCGALARARRLVVAAPGGGAQSSVGFGSKAGSPFGPKAGSPFAWLGNCGVKIGRPSN